MRRHTDRLSFAASLVRNQPLQKPVLKLSTFDQLSALAANYYFRQSPGAVLWTKSTENLNRCRESCLQAAVAKGEIQS
jgi:hypothetical protein